MFLKNISTLHNKGFICCSTKWALQGLISLLDRSNKSTHTHNREIRPAITQRQCEDIPGMLLFDSNLLCVDGLIDADDLGEEQMRKMNNIIQCLRGKNTALCVWWLGSTSFIISFATKVLSLQPLFQYNLSCQDWKFNMRLRVRRSRGDLSLNGNHNSFQ